jgi:hypothetical protein
MSDLEEVIRSSPVLIHARRLAVARLPVNAPDCPGAFAVIRDANETTIIAETGHLPETDCVEDDFLLFEFVVAKPFGAPGFVSAITSALAAHGINVFPVSTYSRDYVLIKSSDYFPASEALVARGFPRPQQLHDR